MLLHWVVFLFAINRFLQKGHAILSKDENLGIWDGRTIQIEEAPYMVALTCKQPTDDDTIKGASIIHERFLLTGARVYWQRPGTCTYVAHIGSNKYMRSNTVLEIEKFMCHKDFNPNVYGSLNDICLAKLKEPLQFSKKVAKIDLPDKNFHIKTGTILNVTGWGMTKESWVYLPVHLKRAPIPLISHKICRKNHKSMDVATQLCAGVKGNGVCWGDEGGPLTYNNIQVGIISYPNAVPRPCGSGMDVYTNVTSFLDWINQTITTNL